MHQPLSLDLSNEEARPYFLWEENLTVAEFRTRLKSENDEERIRYLARLLREARFDDVWKFVTPQQVAGEWNYVKERLGRSQGFWEFILKAWRDYGLIR
jgi:hypothetical protein